MKKLILFSVLASMLLTSSDITTKSGDGYTIDEIYEKFDLDYGTLDEDGNSIDFIFLVSDIEAGTYDIELTDGPGDLYQIKGTDFFLTFNGYFGYAGWGTDCIMVIEGGYYASKVYKK